MRIKGLRVARSGASLAQLVRAAETEESRGAEGPAQLVLRFSPFNEWYEIDSYFEGRFLERTVPGAFKRTLKAAKRADGNYSIKSMFNHGSDFQIGEKLLGTVSEASERDESPELVVDLYEEASYVRDLMQGLRAGDYGSSFMFEVIGDKWDHEPKRSEHNPEGLPERTITETRVYEAGPVTWPANPAATAGLRGGCHTDSMVERMLERDPHTKRDTMALFEAFRAAHNLSASERRSAPTPDVESARHAGELKAAIRRRQNELRLEDARRRG